MRDGHLRARLHLPRSGVLGTGGGLLARLLVHLLIVLLVCGTRLLAGGGVVGDLVGGPHVVDSTELLGQSRQVLGGVDGA